MAGHGSTLSPLDLSHARDAIAGLRRYVPSDAAIHLAVQRRCILDTVRAHGWTDPEVGDALALELDDLRNFSSIT